jgi:hypothetical protein
MFSPTFNHARTSAPLPRNSCVTNNGSTDDYSTTTNNTTNACNQ